MAEDALKLTKINFLFHCAYAAEEKEGYNGTGGQCSGKDIDGNA